MLKIYKSLNTDRYVSQISQININFIKLKELHII